MAGSPPTVTEINRGIKAREMSEEDLLEAVIKYARDHGWRVAHFRPAKTEKGWRTAVQGDGKGFPDLIMVRDYRQIIVELKSESGRLKPEQEQWLDAFRAVIPLGEVYVWKPTDWLDGTIDEVLS